MICWMCEKDITKDEELGRVILIVHDGRAADKRTQIETCVGCYGKMVKALAATAGKKLVEQRFIHER